MKNKGREIALYRFVDQKGIVGYYQTNGKSIEKGFNENTKLMVQDYLQLLE